MGKESPVCPKHKPNPKRGTAKLKRGFGELARKQTKMSLSEWAQKFDPLFKKKGCR